MPPPRPTPMSLHGKLSAVLLLSVALAGCGSGDVDVSTPATSASPGGCRTTVTASDADSSGSVCVAKGGTLTLLMHATPDHRTWSGRISGPAILRTEAVRQPASGVATWIYTAIKVGHTTITAQRPNCPPAAPGGITCHSVQAFSLRVEVS